MRSLDSTGSVSLRPEVHPPGWGAPLLRGLLVLLLLGLGTVACGQGDPQVEESGVPVARVGSRILTVQELVELLGPRRELPADLELVRTVADLWVDHFVLLRAGAREGGFADEELEPLLREQLDQALIAQLRSSVIDVDTILGEDELLSLWREEMPGTRIRARHILLALPPQGSPEARDSVLDRARELRERALGGEEFSVLARRHSDDPSSARSGGDLGFVERGEMIASLDEAAFSLVPGQISEPVESPYGVHLIQIEERIDPEFEAERDAFAQRIRRQRTFRAESTYVARLLEEAEPTVLPGAPEVVRALATRPHQRLYGSAANRPLARYRGGVLTAEEARIELRARNPGVRTQVIRADDEEIEALLEDLLRRKLLLEEVRERELEVPDARRDSLRSRIRVRLEEVVVGLGAPEPSPEGPDLEELEERVLEQLRAILDGRVQVPRLGHVTARLRQELDAHTYPATLPRVVTGIEALREGEGL